jgi:Immunity protein 50
MLEAPDIPGAGDVLGWFGYWPSFHDAEVLSITLDRSHPSRIVVHTWNRTDEVDARGYFVLDKHAIVTFVLEDFLLDRQGITNTQIDGFNAQNVVSSLTVRKTVEGYDLILYGIYGVNASISAKRLRVELSPGKPEPCIGSSLDTDI